MQIKITPIKGKAQTFDVERLDVTIDHKGVRYPDPSTYAPTLRTWDKIKAIELSHSTTERDAAESKMWQQQIAARNVAPNTPYTVR